MLLVFQYTDIITYFLYIVYWYQSRCTVRMVLRKELLTYFCIFRIRKRSSLSNQLAMNEWSSSSFLPCSFTNLTIPSRCLMVVPMPSRLSEQPLRLSTSSAGQIFRTGGVSALTLWTGCFSGIWETGIGLNDPISSLCTRKFQNTSSFFQHGKKLPPWGKNMPGEKILPRLLDELSQSLENMLWPDDTSRYFWVHFGYQ